MKLRVINKYIALKTKDQSGFTLLEYCAGAAIIAGVLWGALTAMGGGMDSLIRAIGTWATNRSAEISGS